MKKLYVCLTVILSTLCYAHAAEFSDKTIIPLDGKQVEFSGEGITWSRILVSISGSEKKLLMSCSNGVVANALLTERDTILEGLTSRFLSGKSLMDSGKRENVLQSDFAKCSTLVDEIKSNKTIILDKLNNTIIVE